MIAAIELGLPKSRIASEALKFQRLIGPPEFFEGAGLWRYDFRGQPPPLPLPLLRGRTIPPFPKNEWQTLPSIRNIGWVKN